MLKKTWKQKGQILPTGSNLRGCVRNEGSRRSWNRGFVTIATAAWLSPHGLPLFTVRNTAHWISCGIDGVATA